jgi:hypothetical protein
MKSTLRSLSLAATLAFSAVAAVTLSSCTEDKCKGTVCAYGGTCVDGACVCPTGYEGPQCETVNRNYYTGIWKVNEDGTRANAAQYDVAIEPNGDQPKLKITNFRNYLTLNVEARVKGDTLTINRQVVNGSTVEGFGVIDSDMYYGEHGVMMMYYYIIYPDGVLDSYGLKGGEPSKWNK